MKRLLRLLLHWLFDLKVSHLERLVFSGPGIIMPNHVSFLDALILYALLPRSCWFVVNAEIATRPWVAFALKFQPHVVVDPRNPYSLRTIISAIRQGNPVVIFPEGRITTTGNLMKMYTGAAMIAWKTSAEIFPVILHGPEFSKFSRMGSKMTTRWFVPIDVFVGSPQRLQLDETLSFRAQKDAMGDCLLSLMQNVSFQARRNGKEKLDFFSCLQMAAARYGSGKTILRDINRTVSYRVLLIGCYVLAEKIRRLIQEDESVVGVLLPNAVAHVTVLFALFKLGKDPAILNFSTGTRNVADSVQTAGCKTVLTSRAFVERGGFEELIRQITPVCNVIYLEDVATTVSFSDRLNGFLQQFLSRQGQSTPQSRIILFTSGTEGKPKGVVLSHRAILSNIDQACSLIDHTPSDRMLNALPMFHSFGLMAGTLLPLLNGIQTFLYPSPLHYRIIPELAYDFNATLMLGTPTFLAGYGKMAHPYDFYALRYILAGGEKLKPAVRDLWQEKFGIRILEGYGITETGPVLCLNTPLAYRRDSVGKFLPGIEWRLEPVEGIEQGGNLWVRGPNLMDGYLLHEKGFLPLDGWFASGDVVTVDSAGYVTISARLKRFAKIAGEMVNLQLVEELATACFGQATFAAVSVHDGRKGERILLFSTFSGMDKAVMRQFLLQENYSLLQLPSDFVRIEKMPLLGSGKPDYLTLQKMAQETLVRQVQ